MAEGRGWARLPGLSAGSQPWGEPSEFCWVFLTPSMGEEGKQLLQSPMRDAHLSWGGGISSSPSASSLPACSQGLSVGMLLAPTGSCPTLCIRRLLGRVFPQNLPLGIGSCGGDNPYLAVPRAPHCSLGTDCEHWGFTFWGCRGRPRAGGGVPPLAPLSLLHFHGGGGRRGLRLERACAGSARAGLEVATASAAPLSLLYKADSLALS